ncbi:MULTISPECIES: 5'-nucleotidase, lipoprotein e(P4) family [unclassified Luteimonas]|uniref:5'-nucleotidase, lipoprotein e(P4) family n=1 Tax=unclassified Luteimonas TaxID=2629088 RepID=UPI0016021E88|nr:MULTISPECIES: 5'-nucleotidase, lipoprotein e(P4) family [unclassified Luteimonas]MBB1473379.1 5'-nucleotidase, lipoprotein e(P4) family [Luteimonas sp. MC1782]MBB6600446.1 5'-nucleotidase, lipoprotein e(P4) family [Luteimonas sp. MC1825]QOC88111.1 5'-nucleotidase, lipoprotein e(P4) family [Luteimonas sp. MC1825]
MRRTLPTLTLLAAVLALGACTTTAPLPGTAPAAVTPAAAQVAVPADDNLNAVLWVQRSVEYRALSETVFRAAGERLDTALATPDWNALVPGERRNAASIAALPPAVVMDIDETVLDNSPYQARLVRDGLEYDDATWAEWVAEEKAKPVPGVLEFARAAHAKGVTVIYLSNRDKALHAATLANLRAVGLPVKDDSVFLGLGTVVEGCEQKGSGKTCRRQLAGRGYRVLMQFGDQLGDFVEAPANTPQAHAALHAEYRAWFGDRWWVLPNPTYGAWEPALFNNAWGQPRTVRRAAKRDALLLDR